MPTPIQQLQEKLLQIQELIQQNQIPKAQQALLLVGSSLEKGIQQFPQEQQTVAQQALQSLHQASQTIAVNPQDTFVQIQNIVQNLIVAQQSQVQTQTQQQSQVVPLQQNVLQILLQIEQISQQCPPQMQNALIEIRSQLNQLPQQPDQAKQKLQEITKNFQDVIQKNQQ